MSVAENQRALVAQSRAVQTQLPSLPVEYRDPTAATQQVRYTAKDAPQVADWDADNAIRQGYLANVICYRCAQINANTIASLPFRAGPDLSKRNTWDSNAYLAKKLGPAPGGPAPKLSARKLFAWSLIQRQITGRFAWELELDDAKNIANLWPLPVSNLKPYPTDSGSEWFSHFTYGRPDKPRRLAAEQVFYDWEPGQIDFRQPETPLQSARYDLSIAVMGDRFAYAFLKNGAVPAHIVVIDQFPERADFERWKQNWRGEFEGPDNGGKTAFIEAAGGEPGGSTPPLSESIYVQTLGVSPKDAKFIEQHKEAMMNVAISMGVPWSKLDASGRTFDNADHEETTWWENTLLPLLRDVEDSINMDLAPRMGPDAGWFDISEVEALRPKAKFATFDVQWMITNDIIKPNEFREDQRLEARPDLDTWKPALPAAPVAADPTGATQEAANDGTTGGDKGGFGSASRPDPEKRTVPSVETRGPDPTAIEARRAATWKSVDSTVRTLEGHWAASMGRLFRRQEHSVIQALNGKRGAKMMRDSAPQIDPSHVFNKGYWTDQTADHTTDLYASTATAGAASVSAKFGIAFDVQSPHAQEFINARANQLAGQVTDTTYSQIRDVLSSAVENGDSIDEIADSIRHVFAVASDSRATTIARTETISAYNGSAQMAAEDLPLDVVGGQEWIATRDGVTREDHADADGQTVALGEPFDVGGDSLDYPGDPNGDPGNVINCRCTIGFLTPEEMGDTGGRSADLHAARAALAMVTRGQPVDELALRRVLKARAA